MLNFNKLCAVIGMAGLLAVAPPTRSDELSDTGEFLDGVAAIVNEGVVLKSQVRDQLSNVIRRASQQDPPLPLPPADILRDQLLERLIMQEVQMQRAERIGLQISDQMLNQALSELAARNGIPLSEFPALLAEDGIDYPKFREEFRDEMTLEQLRQIDVGRRIEVSPRDIEQCIADLEGNVAVDSDYNLSHILISIPENATADELADARAKADDIYRQLQDGANFGEMAVRYSNAETALEGGVLGWMKGAQLPTIYTDVVINLEAGGFSEPFRSASSFHIVRVNDLRSSIQRSEVNQVQVRHILIVPNEIIDDATAKQRLDDARQRIQAGEVFGEVAKLLSDDTASANDGGDMGWTGPGVFVPEFEQVVNDSEIGVLSEPFRSRFGWHILEVTDRRVYDNTEELKEANCRARIQESRMAEETQLWIQRLRDQAFVDKRS